MIIVLDTNVLVSGLLNPYGAPGEIVRLISSADMALAYDARILSEYREVLLRPKFPFEEAQIDSLLEQISCRGRVVAAKPLLRSLADPDDDCFLEVAISGSVDFLVTGNVKHFPVKARQGVNVILPEEFLRKYRKIQDRFP